jgi:hypothetical protein
MMRVKIPSLTLILSCGLISDLTEKIELFAREATLIVL